MFHSLPPVELQWAPDAKAVADPLAPENTVSLTRHPEPLSPALAQFYLWDPWPVLDQSGTMADVHGAEWWIALACSRDMHPEARHDHARMRLLRRAHDGWHDLGQLFPEEASPGSREWSGTTVFDRESSRLRVLYTATGVRGEAERTFSQRIFQARGEVRCGRISSWGPHTEVVAAGEPYLLADERDASPGTCRAFRDPFYFRDPRDGSELVLFAASLTDDTQTHGGAAGIATWQDSTWELQAPLLHARGANRELERPHLLARDGRYYLFFSTHGESFHPRLRARTGLYGFWADDVRGPYLPLNGSGLVLGNPDHAPYAHYAWQVLTDGRVISFVNYPFAGSGPMMADAAFAGTIAPFAQLRIIGDEAFLQTDTTVGATE